MENITLVKKEVEYELMEAYIKNPTQQPQFVYSDGQYKVLFWGEVEKYERDGEEGIGVKELDYEVRNVKTGRQLVRGANGIDRIELTLINNLGQEVSFFYGYDCSIQ